MGKNLITLLFAFTLIASGGYVADFGDDFDDDYASVINRRDPLLDGIFAWWKMDDNNATSTVVDSSGNQYNGTITNLTQNVSVAGQIDRALNLDYSSITVASTPAIQGNITLNAWIYSRGFYADWETAFLYRSTIWRISMRQNNFAAGRLIVAYGSSIVESSAVVAINGWHMITVTINPTTQRFSFYIDGILKNNEIPRSSGTSNFSDASGSLVIGADPYGNKNLLFKISIDDVRVYNRTLSSNEVYTIYNKYK